MYKFFRAKQLNIILNYRKNGDEEIRIEQAGKLL